MSLQKDIAKAIKKADSSYFFEDYDKQAKAVIDTLRKGGFYIVPATPSQEQIDGADHAVKSGRVKPSELFSIIYSAMVKSYKI